ncbi:MAG: hypothetical protein Q7R80_04020 [bacterium]|nr:hypothetical protein [bacterium]
MDGAITLRFAPDAVGSPTVHTVADAGAGTVELWYLPWVHNHPNPAAEPLPTPYIATLADAFVYFGTQADVVGIEGGLWEWDFRDHEISSYAHEIIAQDDITVVRAAHAEVGDMECSMDAEQPPTDIERATRELLSRTTTPVVGVEDPDLILRETGAENPTLDRDRSNTAVVVLLAELRARAGHRALLIFGMAHYADIEDEVRKLGNVTLRVACIPALCKPIVSRTHSP